MELLFEFRLLIEHDTHPARSQVYDENIWAKAMSRIITHKWPAEVLDVNALSMKILAAVFLIPAGPARHPGGRSSFSPDGAPSPAVTLLFIGLLMRWVKI